MIRLAYFKKLRTETYQYCLTGDSKSIDIIGETEKHDPAFAALIKKQKIAGVFSSPPYVGLIDYHEQHAYAYDLFGFKRQDELEIGRMPNGRRNNRISRIFQRQHVKFMKRSKYFLRGVEHATV